MNTLNADACNTEIEEGKKKKKNLRYRDEKETEFTRHRPFHCQNYTTQTSTGNLKVHVGIEIQT